MPVFGTVWFFKAVGAALCGFAALMLLCLLIAAIEKWNGRLR